MSRMIYRWTATHAARAAVAGHDRMPACRRLSLGLFIFGAVLHVLPSSSAPAACGSLTGEAQQACGLAAAIPKSSDTPSPDNGDTDRVVAPLSTDAFRAVPFDRITADPASYLRRPIALGPSRCFYFGVGDYRCVVAGTVPIIIMATIVIPQQSQVSVEQGCGQGSEDITRACRYRALFVPVSSTRLEPGQGGAVVFQTANILAVPEGSAAPVPVRQP